MSGARCASCDREFIAGRADARYCSPACRQRAARSRDSRNASRDTPAITERAAGTTKGERTELISAVKTRSKAAKARADQRCAALLADVEAQLAARFEPEDAAWRDITGMAAAAIREANERLADRCRELGIRETLAPRLHLAWADRGENDTAARRAELRRVAESRAEALRKAAHAEIDAQHSELVIQIVGTGLESAAAREILGALPSVEQLMPALSLAEIESGTP